MTSSATGINEKTHALYEACVGYMVSERSTRDAWAKVCTYVDTAIKGGATVNDIKVELKAVEAQIKVDFSVDALPAAWRSAKSSALKAAKHNIPLIDSLGLPSPKTVVERNTRATKTVASTDYRKAAYDHIYKAIGFCTAMPPCSEGERSDLIAMAELLLANTRSLAIHA